MLEKYLVRAKRLGSGEWVTGLLCPPTYPGFVGGDWYIAVEKDYDFTPSGTIWIYTKTDFDTVCRCTGLRDKNGKLIWEGNIVSYAGAVIRRRGEDIPTQRTNPIVFEEGSFQLQGSGGLRLIRYHDTLNSRTLNAEVIGNVHDNPELWEG